MNNWILAMLVFGGLAAHFLGKLMELRRTEKTLTLKRYVRAHPYQIMYSVVAAAIAGTAMGYYEELTPITAIGAGYMCDSILDKISKRTQSALR